MLLALLVPIALAGVPVVSSALAQTPPVERADVRTADGEVNLSMLVATTDSVEQEIAIIRMRHAAIQRRLRSYEQREVDMKAVGLLDDAAGSGRLQVFSDSVGAVRQVIATRFEDVGYTIHEIFYWDAAPFFMTVTEVKRGDGAGRRPDRRQEYFYFARDGGLVRWVGKTVVGDAAAARARHMQRIAGSYATALNDKGVTDGK